MKNPYVHLAGDLYIESGPWLPYLFGYGGVLEGMESLIKHAGTLIHIHDHRSLALATEETLEQARQLAVSERHNLGVIPVKLCKCIQFTAHTT